MPFSFDMNTDITNPMSSFVGVEEEEALDKVEGSQQSSDEKKEERFSVSSATAGGRTTTSSANSSANMLSSPPAIPKVSSSPSLNRSASDISTTSSNFPLSPSKEVPPVISWAETLKSPTLATFTPAEANSKHGLALLLAIERSKSLAKTNKRCNNIMTELSAHYDQYATALIKAAGQGWPALQESAMAWSAKTSQMSATLRTAVSQPWQAFYTTHSDACAGIATRYQHARQAAAAVRQRALHARNRHRRATMAVLTANGVDGTTTINTTTTKRVVSATPKQRSDISKWQEKYERLVKIENENVKACQRLENMSLESLQKMEEDRAVIVVRGLIQALEAQRVALEETIGSLTGSADPAEDVTAKPHSSTSQSPKRFLFPRRGGGGGGGGTSTAMETETAGAMDAETLGLPPEMGALRDRVRSQIQARRERMQATKTLALFLENVAKTCAKLGTGIPNCLRSKDGADPLHVFMGSCEGARLLRLWDCLVSSLELEAEHHVALAEQLRSLRASKLDPIILHGDRSVKTATESDDACWKQLCEATRAQSRAEAKYRQITAESVKARERLNSEGQASNSSGTGTLVGQHFGSGLAKMFEMMPAGGENAMKILPSGARASFAQRSAEEADQKEAKGKQHLETAIEVAALALDAYAVNARNLLKSFDEDEAKGWDAIKESMGMFIDHVKASRQDHLDSLVGKQPVIQQLRDELFSDLNEWRDMAQQELVSTCVETDEGSTSPDSGFQLTVLLEKLDFQENGEVMEDNVSIDTSKDGILDDEEEDFDDTGNEEDDEVASLSEHGDLDGTDESHMQKLFRRSFSAPPNLRTKLDIRGKLRRNKLRGGSDHEDFETDLFLTYFWPDVVDAKKVTTIVDSYACSFRDGGQKIPFQYGRVYLTPSRIIFTSWTRKKLTLPWSDVSQVKPSKGFHGLRNDTLHVICRKKESGDFSCMTLGGFYDRTPVHDQIEKLREQAKIQAEQQAAAEAAAEAAEAKSEDVSGAPKIVVEEGLVDRSLVDVAPPDEKIGEMTIVVSKTIHDISVQKFYDLVWVEKDKPFYKPWLEQSAFDVELESWKEGRVTGTWCKEEYQMSRMARFKVKRTTHLYIGPPIANVVQTHRVRLEGNNKCIASMTIEFEGIPYSDTFAVEVRYVARRAGNDIKYDCGLFVDFRKSTFLKRQIQAGTIEESTPVYKNFYKKVHAACVEARGGDVAEAAAEAEAEEKEAAAEAEKVDRFKDTITQMKENPQTVGMICFAILGILIRLMFSSRVPPEPVPEEPSSVEFEMDLIIGRMDKLEDQISRLQSSLNEVLLLLKENANN